MLSFVSLVIALCVNLIWTPHITRPADADISCFVDQNDTVWCAPDVWLENETDPEDSY